MRTGNGKKISLWTMRSCRTAFAALTDTELTKTVAFEFGMSNEGLTESGNWSRYHLARDEQVNRITDRQRWRAIEDRHVARSAEVSL